MDRSPPSPKGGGASSGRLGGGLLQLPERGRLTHKTHRRRYRSNTSESVTHRYSISAPLEEQRVARASSTAHAKPSHSSSATSLTSMGTDTSAVGAGMPNTSVVAASKPWFFDLHRIGFDSTRADMLQKEMELIKSWGEEAREVGRAQRKHDDAVSHDNLAALLRRRHVLTRRQEKLELEIECVAALFDVPLRKRLKRDRRLHRIRTDHQNLERLQRKNRELNRRLSKRRGVYTSSSSENTDKNNEQLKSGPRSPRASPRSPRGSPSSLRRSPRSPPRASPRSPRRSPGGSTRSLSHSRSGSMGRSSSSHSVTQRKAPTTASHLDVLKHLGSVLEQQTQRLLKNFQGQKVLDDLRSQLAPTRKPTSSRNTFTPVSDSPLPSPPPLAGDPSAVQAEDVGDVDNTGGDVAERPDSSTNNSEVGKVDEVNSKLALSYESLNNFPLVMGINPAWAYEMPFGDDMVCLTGPRTLLALFFHSNCTLVHEDRLQPQDADPLWLHCHSTRAPHIQPLPTREAVHNAEEIEKLEETATPLLHQTHRRAEIVEPLVALLLKCEELCSGRKVTLLNYKQRVLDVDDDASDTDADSTASSSRPSSRTPQDARSNLSTTSHGRTGSVSGSPSPPSGARRRSRYSLAALAQSSRRGSGAVRRWSRAAGQTSASTVDSRLSDMHASRADSRDGANSARSRPLSQQRAHDRLRAAASHALGGLHLQELLWEMGFIDNHGELVPLEDDSKGGDPSTRLKELMVDPTDSPSVNSSTRAGGQRHLPMSAGSSRMQPSGGRGRVVGSGRVVHSANVSRGLAHSTTSRDTRLFSSNNMLVASPQQLELLIQHMKARVSMQSRFVWEMHPHSTGNVWMAGVARLKQQELVPSTKCAFTLRGNKTAMAVSSDGSVWWAGRQRDYTMSLRDRNVIGFLIDLYVGTLSVFADGMPCGVAFGIGSPFNDVEQQEQANIIRCGRGQLLPIVALRGASERTSGTRTLTSSSAASLGAAAGVPVMHRAQSHTSSTSLAPPGVSSPSPSVTTVAAHMFARPELSLNFGRLSFSYPLEKAWPLDNFHIQQRDSAEAFKSESLASVSFASFRPRMRTRRSHRDTKGRHTHTHTHQHHQHHQHHLHRHRQRRHHHHSPAGTTTKITMSWVTMSSSEDEEEEDEKETKESKERGKDVVDMKSTGPPRADVTIGTRKAAAQATPAPRKEIPLTRAQAQFLGSLEWERLFSWSKFPPRHSRIELAVRIIQRNFRKWRARRWRQRQWKKLELAAVAIQRCWRHYWDAYKGRYVPAVVVCQRMLRGKLARQKVAIVRRHAIGWHQAHAAATIIQKVARGRIARKLAWAQSEMVNLQLAHLNYIVVFIQRLWRARLSHRKLHTTMTRASHSAAVLKMVEILRQIRVRERLLQLGIPLHAHTELAPPMMDHAHNIAVRQIFRQSSKDSVRSRASASSSTA